MTKGQGLLDSTMRWLVRDALRVPPAATALVIPIPAAASVAADVRARHDRATQAGIPPHITLLYPFLPVDRIRDRITVLARVFEKQQPIEFVLASTGRFPNVAYLVPDPAEPFAELISALTGYFPETPPYRGVHATVVPHLTLVESADQAVLEAAIATAQPALPLRAVAETALLLQPAGRRWETFAEFRFGVASVRGGRHVLEAPIDYADKATPVILDFWRRKVWEARRVGGRFRLLLATGGPAEVGRGLGRWATRNLRRNTGKLRLRLRMNEARRKGRQLIVAFADIDRMTDVEARIGRKRGSRVIRAARDAIVARVGQHGFVFRYGSDEYVCVLDRIDVEGARSALAEARRDFSERQGYSFSVGVVEMDAEDDVYRLIRRADVAMMKEKPPRFDIAARACAVQRGAGSPATWAGREASC